MENKNVNEVVETVENEGSSPVEVHVSVVERENDNYVIMKNDEGKYIRKAKFKEYSSIKPKDRKEKVWYLNLMEGNEETGNGLKDHIGKQFEVANIIIRKYDRINEDTGEQEFGVLTYLITPTKEAYVTSSKTVYFSIARIMELFGTPDSPEWENITVKVTKKKGENGDIIGIKMVG